MDTEKKNLIKQLTARIKSAWAAIRPDEKSWRGAAYGILVLFALLLALTTLGLGATSRWAVISLVALVATGLVLALLTGALSDLIFTLQKALPGFYRAILIGAGVMLALFIFNNQGTLGQIVLTAALLLAGSLVGGAVPTLARGRWRALARAQRAALVASLASGLGLLVAAAWLYAWPGPAVPPAVDVAGQSAGQVRPLEAADPSQPGAYIVKTLTYGSGTDRQRPEYGPQVGLRTGNVDGSPFIDHWKGAPGRLRTAYWGFDAAHLPLNGRVWYPAGEGLFPLVLVVHGNHSMMDFSDPGYAYLGQLLASRGMILVSVDENFLNSSWTDLPMFEPFGVEGMRRENDARGWLLLEHLSQWRRWNADPASPFYKKIDLDRLALIGHSRGGEAAAVAAAFNRLPCYPDDARVKFDYHFNLRAVVAIAPADGQYRPAGRGTPLENINYFVIQGAYDGDMRAFEGLRQYNRVRFTGQGDWFKAALYVDRANHGQFNTSWGRSDRGGFPGPGLLNLTPILPAPDQEQIAKVTIAAFLEAALNGRDEYRPLFQDPRRSRSWLPAVAMIARYQDSRTQIFADFEEDIDLTTGSAAGVALSGQNLSQWYEQRVETKWGDQDTSAVLVGWERSADGKVPAYQVILPGLEVTPRSVLVFALADVEPGSKPIDLTVELQDRAGNTAILPLSHFSLLQPQISFYTRKARLLEDGVKASEPVPQSFAFPLADFQSANPLFDPAGLASVRLVFDRNEKGLILLDDLGLQD